MRAALILSLAVAFALQGARSEDATFGHVAMSLSHTETDPTRGTPGEGAGLHVAYGRPLTARWRWESVFSQTTFDTGDSAGTDFYRTSVGVDFARSFGTGDGPRPSVWLGFALSQNDVYPDDDDGVDALINAGIGLQSRPLGRAGVSWRGRVMYVHDEFRTGMRDWRLEIGVSLPVGRERIVERVVERAVEPREKEPQIVYVEPPDADGDGVVDRVDRCPNTLPDALVDATGCIREPQAVELDGVNFEFGSARLTESAERILQRVALALRDQTDVRVEIAGHTDSVGSDAANLALSQARADEVRVFLVGMGTRPDRLTAVGYGERQPQTSEVTDSDRARNRRVEFRMERIDP